MKTKDYLFLTPAQKEQYHMIQKEKEYRDKLDKLAQEEKILEFWQCYLTYLEYCKIISPYRKTLYIMIKLTLRKLKNEI